MRSSLRSSVFLALGALSSLAALTAQGAPTALTTIGAALNRTEIPVDDLPEELLLEVPLGLQGFGERPEESDDVVELGRALFFSGDLSSDGSVACASCHRPDAAFGDNRAFSLGVDDQPTQRNTPPLLNKTLDTIFSWDGRAKDLAEQVLLPIEKSTEMNLPLDQAVQRLRADAQWSERFKAAFDAEPSQELLARSLSAFIWALSFGNSPVDRFREGEFHALSEPERSGLWLFESKAGCWRCHAGDNFSDSDFHNTGVGAAEGVPQPGRASVTGKAEDNGSFKTPGLRALTQSAPYMHDGSLQTLEEVVQFYRDGGVPNERLSSKLKPLDLTDDEAANLVAFLKALSVRERGLMDGPDEAEAYDEAESMEAGGKQL